jgi:hypothetical protein
VRSLIQTKYYKYLDEATSFNMPPGYIYGAPRLTILAEMGQSL